MNETLVANQLSGFLRLDQVLQLIPVSKATWWNGCRSGQFPKPYKLAPRVTAWKTSEIQHCMDGFLNDGQMTVPNSSLPRK